ncbi:MAG: hypothetical protein U1F58_10550 [Burkholderiales bacterium]
MNASRILANAVAAAVLAVAGLSTAQMMPGPMATTNYFPVVDGARYDYVFVGGHRATATAVMHTGQPWAGMTGLTGVHTTYACHDGVACDPDDMAFYSMGPDGMHYHGGAATMPDGTHYMLSLSSPEWLLKNPVMPGGMMGGGMGYRNPEMWQAGVSGTNTMMGMQVHTSHYQAMAVETVVTPAGTFPDALRVHEQRGPGDERDVWYAAGVGVVRWRDAAGEAVLTAYARAAGAVPKVVFAIEFYHAGLDHYFVTSDPDETAALDDGRLAGWQRTGMGFNVVAPTDATGAARPVCRYYGNPAYGLDTHFYSASTEECAETGHRWPAQWTLESPHVFGMLLPDMATGACPAGTMPVYRSWNGRTDSNHRYTTDPAVHHGMLEHGHVAEGYGRTPVAMCSPQ